MKYTIYTILFMLIGYNAIGQEVLNEGRADDITPNIIVQTQKLTDNFNEDQFNGSDQDDKSAQAIKAQSDVIYPIDIEDLKTNIRNGAAIENVEDRLDDLTQQIYDLTLFNEQLSQENIDIKRSLAQCCNASKIDNASFLVQNSPNPFSDNTKIDYFLSSVYDNAQIVIRTIDGNVVMSLDGLKSGYNSLDLSSEQLSSGYYIYTLYNGSSVIDSKVLIIAE